MRVLLGMLPLLFPCVGFAQQIPNGPVQPVEVIRHDLDQQRLLGGNLPQFFEMSPSRDLTELECDSAFSIVYAPKQPSQDTSSGAKMKVFGWHPWYMGSAYYSYDFSSLGTVAYYGYELNPRTGGYLSIHNWRSTGLITMAHAAKCKVELAVTNTTRIPTGEMLSDAGAVQTLIDSLIGLVMEQDADGITIAFEDLRAQDRLYFMSFLWELRTRLDYQFPKGTITVAVPPFDWEKVYDLDAVNQLAAQVVVMGYNFYGEGCERSGPVSALKQAPNSIPLDLGSSLDYYLRGIDSSKVMLGLPWYGTQWQVKPGSGDAEYIGTVPLRSVNWLRESGYKLARDTANARSLYYKRIDDEWNVVWMDDSDAFGRKAKFAVDKGIGGIAIWGLGYDNGVAGTWESLSSSIALPDTGGIKLPVELPADAAGIIAWLKSLTLEEVGQLVAIVVLVVFAVCFAYVTWQVAKDCRVKEAVLSRTNLLLLCGLGLGVVLLIGYNLIPAMQVALQTWFPVMLAACLIVAMVIFLLGRLSKREVDRDVP